MATFKDDIDCSENNPEAEDEDDEMKESPSTILSFLTFGLMNYFTFTVTISGAQDIMAARSIGTSMNLVAHMVPIVLITNIFPFFIRRMPYFVRVLIVSITNAVGFVIVAYVKQAEWKLFGIGLASVGFGFGNMSLIALTSYFGSSSLAAYSAGTGMGFFVAPLYYTGMTYILFYLVLFILHKQIRCEKSAQLGCGTSEYSSVLWRTKQVHKRLKFFYFVAPN